MTVCAMITTPPPAMSCLIPCDFAPGLSFPYPSRRLMIPHTAMPAPIAVITVFNVVTAEEKNAILVFSKIADYCFIVQNVFLRQNPKEKRA